MCNCEKNSTAPPGGSMRNWNISVTFSEHLVGWGFAYNSTQSFVSICVGFETTHSVSYFFLSGKVNVVYLHKIWATFRLLRIGFVLFHRATLSALMPCVGYGRVVHDGSDSHVSFNIRMNYNCKYRKLTPSCNLTTTSKASHFASRTVYTVILFCDNICFFSLQFPRSA